MYECSSREKLCKKYHDMTWIINEDAVLAVSFLWLASMYPKEPSRSVVDDPCRARPPEYCWWW